MPNNHAAELKNWQDEYNQLTTKPMLIKDLAKINAEEILTNYHDGVFPVDTLMIANCMGLKIYTADMTWDTSSICIKKRRWHQPKIYLNGKHPKTRQQVALAHAIGHIYDRTQRDDQDYSFKDIVGQHITAYEIYADWFAMYLLMPEVEIRKLIEAGESELTMMRHFKVSASVIQTRLKKLT